jgi:hypothetical protein
MTATLVEQDQQLVRFYIPEKAHWSTVAAVTTGLGQALTDAVRAVAERIPDYAAFWISLGPYCVRLGADDIGCRPGLQAYSAGVKRLLFGTWSIRRLPHGLGRFNLQNERNC